MRLLADNDVLPLVAGMSFTTAPVRPDLLDDTECGPLLRVYTALTDGRLGTGLSVEDRLYNRYLWFRRFANAYRAKFGHDAGIEQQAFQILERGNCNVDWAQVELLDAASRRKQ